MGMMIEKFSVVSFKFSVLSFGLRRLEWFEAPFFVLCERRRIQSRGHRDRNTEDAEKRERSGESGELQRRSGTDTGADRLPSRLRASRRRSQHTQETSNLRKG